MEEALVLKSTGKWYTLELSTGQIVQARIRGKLRLEGLSTTNPIAAGDKVFLLPDVDSEGIRLIDNIVPRKNYLVRKSTNLSKQMQILAANIDHAYLVVTLKSPVTQIAFIDRFLVSAESFRIPTTILFNKTDLYGEEELGLLAVLKNIYAVGAGIAHGLDYGDNFLSVLIANSANEMAGFLKKAGIKNIEVGQEESSSLSSISRPNNYAASVYLGDLLVTCYSLYSRNRTFGKMIGMGHEVKSAQLEMSMVAEGYPASKSIYQINKGILATMPIAETVYKILWENLPAREGFTKIESILV